MGCDNSIATTVEARHHAAVDTNPLSEFSCVSAQECCIIALEEEERTLSQLADELTASSPFQHGRGRRNSYSVLSQSKTSRSQQQLQACDPATVSVISLGPSCRGLPRAMDRGALSISSYPAVDVLSPRVPNPLETPLSPRTPFSPLGRSTKSTSTVECIPLEDGDTPLSPFAVERELRFQEAVDRLANLNLALKNYDCALEDDTQESSQRYDSPEAKVKHTSNLKERVRSLRIKISRINSKVGICQDCAPTSPSLAQQQQHCTTTTTQCALCKKLIMADLPCHVEDPAILKDLRQRKMSAGW